MTYLEKLMNVVDEALEEYIRALSSQGVSVSSIEINTLRLGVNIGFRAGVDWRDRGPVQGKEKELIN